MRIHFWSMPRHAGLFRLVVQDQLDDRPREDWQRQSTANFELGKRTPYDRALDDWSPPSSAPAKISPMASAGGEASEPHLKPFTHLVFRIGDHQPHVIKGST